MELCTIRLTEIPAMATEKDVAYTLEESCGERPKVIEQVKVTRS